MGRFVCLFLLQMLVINLSAQQFGAFSPHTKWKQINTDTARIIFTPGTQEQAQRIATIIHKMAATPADPLGSTLHKINIVLHGNTTLANGYVGLAPFRSEYYLVPGGNIFDFGNTPWAEQLAVHEYRHVQQYNNFNNGISKAFSYIMGEEGQAFVNALSIPDWFFEGDAVHNETAVTLQGRGRLPYFLNAYNSLWQQQKNYSWMKLRNGSLKDYVPNHYYLGYLLVNYGYEKYGADFWKNVTHNASAFKGLIYPFQKAIKQYTGIDYKQFRTDALHYYKQQLPQGQPQKKSNKNTVTSYYFPQQVGSDSLLYLKTGYNQLPQFIIKNKRGEYTIKKKGIGPEEWFSYKNGLIAYTAYSTDKRWSLTDYSNIVLLDIHTKKERWLTRKGKYYTPSLSPGGKQLICVAINDSLQTELNLIEVASGNILKTIKASDNSFYSNPCFIDERTIITGVRLASGLLSLQKISLVTNEREDLIPATPNTMGFPFVQNDTVYFTATFSGNDDLYALRLKDKKVYTLTKGSTGNYFAHVTGDSLTWSVFTADGFKIRKAAVNTLLWQEVNNLQLEEQVSIYKVADAGINILQTPSRTFPVSTYAKSFRLLNFHSWQPNYEAPEYRVTALSNNILNTLTTEVYYKYNENERSHAAGTDILYGGWFPVLSAGANYTFNRHVTTPTRQLIVNQYELRGGYYIPLDFTKGNTYKLLNFGSEYVYNQLQPTAAYKNEVKEQHINYLHHFINWRQQLPTAVQHIYPRLGYAASINYNHRLQNFGYQLLTNGDVYLPSPVHNHGIVFTGSLQQTDTGNIVFSNNFVIARGYSHYYFAKMWRASANYYFPLAYPDWGFGNIAYMLRGRANLFYDYTKVYSKTRSIVKELRSAGAEVFFDTRWWNQLPVSFGMRYSYLLDDPFNNGMSRHRFELVLPVNLIPN